MLKIEKVLQKYILSASLNDWPSKKQAYLQ